MRSRRSYNPLFFVAFIIVTSAVGHTQSTTLATAAGKFAYSGDDGPGFWSNFDSRCAATSTRQSPIDIDHVTVDAHLTPLDLVLPKTQVELVNPGYTVQANAPGAGFLMLDGDRYSLLQFHFHTLSEHTVEGRRGVMELHLVFQNDQDKYAVVGVIFRIGHSNEFLQELVEAGLPQTTHAAPVNVVDVDIEHALTDTSDYYTYAGSLTTPPCSENVTWLVLKQWAEASPEQFEAFRKILGNDFRPLQNRSGRKIRATKGKDCDAGSEPHK